MTEEQIAELLVQIGEEMRKWERVQVDWLPERVDLWYEGRQHEPAGRRYITITLDMPKGATH